MVNLTVLPPGGPLGLHEYKTFGSLLWHGRTPHTYLLGYPLGLDLTKQEILNINIPAKHRLKKPLADP